MVPVTPRTSAEEWERTHTHAPLVVVLAEAAQPPDLTARPHLPLHPQPRLLAS